MKQIFKFNALVALACAMFAFAACTEKPEEEGKEPAGPEVVVPEMEAIEETIDATGANPTVIVIEVEEGIEWTVEPDEDYDWIDVDEYEGVGEGEEIELTFTAEPNNDGKDRSATFMVYGTYADNQEPLYEIFIAQDKNELPFGEGDYAFLKELVDGQMLGESTPIVEDWYSFDSGVMSGTGINLENKEGKYYITAIDGAPLTGWPSVTNLPELTLINLRGQKGLEGKELSAEWNTPKLKKVNISITGLTGVIPEGFASTTPVLSEIYLDGCDLYGALPHNWASEVLEVVLFSSLGNHGFKKDAEENPTDEPAHNTHEGQSPGLGYLIPASLDVILNENRTAQGDKTQMKVGGPCNGNWLGFEKGWGQERYEKYDPNAVAGDTSTWSDMRLLVGDSSDEVSSWAYYFSNMGYPGLSMCIPHEMLDWDQAAADAYTAQCRAARGK